MAQHLLNAMLAAQMLSCKVESPKEIVVRFPVEMNKSIKYFSVESERGWYYVVNDNIRLSPYYPKMHVLKIDTQRQAGIRYKDGRSKQGTIFDHRGKYKLVFSDNVDTEPENMDSVTCTVNIGR